MKIKSAFFVCIIFLLSVLNIFAQSNSNSNHDNWPGFRGPNGSGLALESTTPLEWDAATGKNIKWKIDVPGLSLSSPIVWGNKLFITAAISSDKSPPLKVGLYGDIKPVEDEPSHKWKVYCIDKNTGNILWEKVSHEGVPIMKRHPKSSHANPSPATDGKYVVAFFASEGLYCYDMDGNLQWKKDFGPLDSGFFIAKDAQWGYAGSPIIHNGRVIIQCDVQEGSFITALDVKTGEEIWRTARNDVPTWSTPTIYTVNNQTRIAANGWKHIGGYDFETGKEVWKLKGGGDIPTPTPQIAHNLIFINNAHGKMSPIYAIKTSAEGDISLEKGKLSNENVVWSIERGSSYMQTALVYVDLLYSCRDNGTISCYDAKTGELYYKQRLGELGTGFVSSPVASDGKIYYSSEKGDIFVIKPGKEFEQLAQNALGEIIMATPAISGKTLFVRTKESLFAIEDDK